MMAAVAENQASAVAVALLSGTTDDAESYLLRSIEIGGQLGWRSSVAYDLSNLGGLAKERQDYAAADTYLRQAEDIAKEVGLAELLPVIIANRGEVAFESGDVESACRFWSESGPALATMGSAHAETVNQMANDAACPLVVSDHGEP